MKIESAQIRDVLINEVIKREVLDGDQADTAKKKIARAAKKPLRKVTKPEVNGQEVEEANEPAESEA